MKPNAEGFTEFLIFLISALGLALDPPVFLACVLLSGTGSVFARTFMQVSKRAPLVITLGAGLFLSLVLILVNEAYFDFRPQLAAAGGGFASVIVLPWLVRKFPSLADMAADKFLGGGK